MEVLVRSPLIAPLPSLRQPWTSQKEAENLNFSWGKAEHWFSPTKRHGTTKKDQIQEATTGLFWDPEPKNLYLKTEVVIWEGSSLLIVPLTFQVFYRIHFPEALSIIKTEKTTLEKITEKLMDCFPKLKDSSFTIYYIDSDGIGITIFKEECLRIFYQGDSKDLMVKTTNTD